MIQDAIFRSTSQALHFAYLIQAYEVGAESVMSKVIRRMLETLGIMDGTHEPSTVSFGGLSPLEIRGQCALIRLSVETCLPPPEAWAIKARYGITKIIERKGEPRAYAFAEYRISAMRSLADYLAPSFPSVPRQAIMWLIAKSCGENPATRPSFRDIEELTGGSKSELHRVYPLVKERIRVLENLGTDRLTPIFAREGIVPETEYA
ncbi:MAG TPA: hypothetical protein VIK69_08465 [Methylophilaceae bacterium]